MKLAPVNWAVGPLVSALRTVPVGVPVPPKVALGIVNTSVEVREGEHQLIMYFAPADVRR